VDLGTAAALDDMSKVIVVNAGSASLKVGVLDDGNAITGSLELDRWDGSPDHPELADFLRGHGSGSIVGHRVVHGGSRFAGPVILDDSALAGIRALTSLAPLHQPRAIAGIEAGRKVLPDAPAVACFDTAFHATLPDVAARYALPAEWNGKFGLRRYGFHGLSHEYASRRAAELVGHEISGLRIVSCHLGGGGSLAAISGGRSVDTTMGFTPLEGLVMATRSGSVDPGLLLWLLQQDKVSLEELSAGLEQRAGLAGLAGLPSGSGDLRDVRAAADAGDPAAQLAIDVYVHRLRREIAAMAAAMNGLDVLVFTGGIGEHHPRVRADTTAGLAFLGVRLDASRNTAATSDTEIGDSDGPVRTLVITAREDLEIARQARDVVASS
jgi:acetate kinase